MQKYIHVDGETIPFTARMMSVGETRAQDMPEPSEPQMFMDEATLTAWCLVGILREHMERALRQFWAGSGGMDPVAAGMAQTLQAGLQQAAEALATADAAIRVDPPRVIHFSGALPDLSRIRPGEIVVIPHQPERE